MNAKGRGFPRFLRGNFGRRKKMESFEVVERSQDLNPWNGRGSALGVNLGDPARLLTAARRHGLLQADTIQEMEGYAESKVPERSSVKIIKILREIADLTEELHQLEIFSHQLALDQEMGDFTRVDQLEARLARVNGFLAHLSDAVNGKDIILGQLQTTVVESSVKIDTPYQMHAHRVFKSLGEFVTALPSNLSSLEWAHQLQLDKTQLAEKLSNGEQLLSQCQTIYNTAHKLHQIQQAPGST